MQFVRTPRWITEDTIEDQVLTQSAPDVSADVPAEGREFALRIAEILADTPASQTLVLDIHQISSIADYFVICSGENERQLRAISGSLLDELSDEKVRPRRTEGTPESGWIVLDFGDSIVHIFDVDQRDFYRLESLWSEAPTLVSMQ